MERMINTRNVTVKQIRKAGKSNIKADTGIYVPGKEIILINTNVHKERHIPPI